MAIFDSELLLQYSTLMYFRSSIRDISLVVPIHYQQRSLKQSTLWQTQRKINFRTL